MAEKDKLSRERRKAGRKEKREGIRTQKATELAKSQAASRGEDWESIGKAPIVNPRIPETLLDIEDKTAKAKKEGTIKAPSDIEKLRSKYGSAALEDVPARSQKQLIAQARKQRQAKFGDILTAVGRGMQRKGVDPDMLKGNRLRQEEEDKYKEFKDVAERNRKAKTAWDNQLRMHEIATLQKKRIEEKDYKYKSAQIQIQLDKLTWEQVKYDKDQEAKKLDRASKEKIAGMRVKSGKRKAEVKSKTKYTDKYTEVTNADLTILNELAKTKDYPMKDGELAKPLDAPQTETLSKVLIERMYEEDENGKLVPIPGMENYIDNLSNSIEQTKAKQTEIDNLETEQYDKIQNTNRWQKETINEEYLAKIDKAQAELKQIKLDTRNLMEGNIPAKSQEKLDEFFK